MAGRAPTCNYDNQQHIHSRNDFRQFQEQSGAEQQQTAYQVDSWRSYRNDTTNLQQTAGYASMHGHAYVSHHQFSPYQRGQYTLNPSASSFQPTSYQTVPAQTHFTPYQPLRVSNGQQEKRVVQQARSNSSVTSNQISRGYALRSRGRVDPQSLSRDVPIPSVEAQTRYSSSIPENLSRKPDLAYLRRITPRGPSRTVSPPPTPSPSSAYITQASIRPTKLATPKKLLVVVDLNGTLLKRAASRGTNFVLRPGVAVFMDYLFANHVVMIYTSARPENAQVMVKKLLHPKQRGQLAAIWARDQLDLTMEQYHAKVQVYKKLEKIWADKEIQKRADEGCKWDQTNTVLLDDTHLKALAQPYNLLKVEEFLNDKPHGGKDNGKDNIVDKNHLEALNAWNAQQMQIIRDLETKLEALRRTADVSSLIRTWQLSDAEITDPVNDQSLEAEQFQLMTPKSPEPEVNMGNESDGGVATRQVDIGGFAGAIDSQRTEESKATQDTSDGDASERSVSPIDDAVWSEILGIVEGKGVATADVERSDM